MTRTIYRVYTDSCEKRMSWSEAEKLSISFVLDNMHDHFPELQSETDNEQEALATLKKFENHLDCSSYNGWCLAHMVVAYVSKDVETLDENDEDAEWEWDCIHSEPIYAVAEGLEKYGLRQNEEENE